MSNPEPAEGSVPAGDFEPVPEEVPPVLDVSNKSISEVAQEVIAGHWGRGNDRKRRLQAAGYDVEAISAEVIKIFNQ